MGITPLATLYAEQAKPHDNQKTFNHHNLDLYRPQIHNSYTVSIYYLFAISLVVVKSVKAMMVSLEIGLSDSPHGIRGILAWQPPTGPWQPVMGNTCG